MTWIYDALYYLLERALPLWEDCKTIFKPLLWDLRATYEATSHLSMVDKNLVANLFQHRQKVLRKDMTKEWPWAEARISRFCLNFNLPILKIFLLFCGSRTVVSFYVVEERLTTFQNLLFSIMTTIIINWLPSVTKGLVIGSSFWIQTSKDLQKADLPDALMFFLNVSKVWKDRRNLMV